MPIDTPAAANSHSTGMRLRAARDARGLSLAEIGGALRIKPHFLEALEADRLDALPTPTHASGFLRSYAKFLGVESVAATELTAAIMPPLAPPLAPPNPLLAAVPTVLVLVGLGLLYTLWQWLQPPPPAPIAPPPAALTAPKIEPLEPQIEPKAELKPATPVVPVDVVATADATADTKAPIIAVDTDSAPVAATPATSESAAPTPSVKPAKIVVRALADSWVQIIDANGRQLYSRLMRAGESWPAPAEPGLRLSTGNAGGLVIVRNGEAGAPLGSQAQVLRNLALTPTVAKPAPVQATAPVLSTDGAMDLEE